MESLKTLFTETLRLKSNHFDEFYKELRVKKLQKKEYFRKVPFVILLQ